MDQKKSTAKTINLIFRLLDLGSLQQHQQQTHRSVFLKSFHWGDFLGFNLHNNFWFFEPLVTQVSFLLYPDQVRRSSKPVHERQVCNSLPCLQVTWKYKFHEKWKHLFRKQNFLLVKCLIRRNFSGSIRKTILNLLFVRVSAILNQVVTYKNRKDINCNAWSQLEHF